MRERKKPGRISHCFHVMYGVMVPQSVKDAVELDTESGNMLWTDTVRKEVASLLALDCFEFHAQKTNQPWNINGPSWL